MKTVHINTPFTEENVRELALGDIVYFSGKFFTCRTLFHKRALEHNYLPLIDFNKINVMMHAGPVMRRTVAGWELVAIAPTTSIRFEKYTPEIIKRLGLRAIIGKATMREDTIRAMKELGCVHLTVVGVPSGLLTTKVKRVVEVHDVDEIGVTEATWVFDVGDFGPFLVGIDTEGNNIFDDVYKKTKSRLQSAYNSMGIPPNYTYTET